VVSQQRIQRVGRAGIDRHVEAEPTRVRLRRIERGRTDAELPVRPAADRERKIPPRNPFVASPFRPPVTTRVGSGAKSDVNACALTSTRVACAEPNWSQSTSTGVKLDAGIARAMSVAAGSAIRADATGDGCGR
jgi:hypothetical protein